MELRTLLPGRDVEYPIPLPGDLAPGEYRFLTQVEVADTGARQGMRSDPIRVEG